MVKLTTEYLSSNPSRVLSKKNKVQTNQEFLRKKTQLRLHDQRIHDIGDFSICKNLTVLYLHNNCITEIKHLDHAVNLTHLYLQNNKIAKIENLEKLRNLSKLYLGFNEISVLEGLENQELLEELHLEKQRLEEGEELHFDPRSIETLAPCLRLLEVSSCGLRSLQTLLRLRALERLRAQANPLADSAPLAEAMRQGAWPQLRELQLQGCPATRDRRHALRLVAAAPHCFQLLDGREVADSQRSFMRGLQQQQALRARCGSDAALDPEPLLRALAPDVGEMALRLPAAVRRAVSRTLLEETAAAAAAMHLDAGARLPVALPLPHVAPAAATAAYPAWRPPQMPMIMEGGGDGVCGMGDGGVTGSGAGRYSTRPRAKVPRPFWRHRSSAPFSGVPRRTTSSGALHLPDL